MNSKFSNNMPEAKCKNFGNMEAIKSLSIKLIEMMDVVKAKNEWGVEQIEAFEQQSKERLIKALQDFL
jgi:selenocysteine lyase/cysteine desulfurase